MLVYADLHEESKEEEDDASSPLLVGEAKPSDAPEGSKL